MTLGHREWEVGRHQLHFEPPDILWVSFRGVVSLADAIRMVEVTHMVGTVHPFFLVGNMREAGLPDPEAGRYLSENLRYDCYLGSIYIGARLVQRAMAKGIRLAAYLTEHTTDERVPERTYFVSTKEEALALIAQLRADP